MKTYLFIAFAGSLLLATACKKNSKTADADKSPTNNTTGPSVETNPPNSDYKPAFEGQTRVPGVKTLTAYHSTVLTSSLTAPWGIASMPDGRFLITEKGGTMRIVTATGQVGAALTGVPAVNAAGQGGLLGLCLDPDFSTNRMVYWSFSEKGATGSVLAVAKGKLSANESGLEGLTVIYRATPAYSGTNQYGGRVIFDRNGNLFVSSGDRSDPGIRVQAQDVNSGIGKIIHISTSGQAVAGNPFIGQANARPEIYLGHRNEYGLVLHPVTGDLWEGELGPRGGDEINIIKPGANYGWPVITYGIDYSGVPIGTGIQQQAGMEQPIYYWDPVISPSGMTFYKGNRIPEWENNLFVCALSGMHIARLTITNNKIAGEERLLGSEGQRFRDITQGPDNALYAITDQGRLYKIDR